MENISVIEFKFIPIMITCSEEETIKRMTNDGRDTVRIKRALAVRSIYDEIETPKIDTTGLTVEMTVNKLVEIIENY